MFATLQLGATAVLFPGWPDAKAVAGVIARHRPTIVLSVPTFYRNMLRDGVTAELLDLAREVRDGVRERPFRLVFVY